MAVKETSSRISAIAARWVNADWRTVVSRVETDPTAAAEEIRALAASALGQDETKGQGR